MAILANLAQAFAVIVAVILGIVQLHQLRTQRGREAAFALLQSIQSPQMLHGILIIDCLPQTAGKAEFDGLPEADQADVTVLLSTCESLGILVFHHEIPLQMVDDFYSGTLLQSWNKLQRHVEELREATSRATRWEWFERLARVNAGSGISHPAHSRAHSIPEMGRPTPKA